MTNTRVQHIDIAKGISICLIAIYHSEFRGFISSIIEPMSMFRVPLFFVLSGVFFSWQTRPIPFFAKNFDALLKPYFSIMLLNVIALWVLGNDILLYGLKTTLYATGPTISSLTYVLIPLWFLPHLFAVYAFSYFLFRFAKFYLLNLCQKIIFMLFFLTLGIFFIESFWHVQTDVIGQSVNLPGLPLSFDIILITSFYFICGNLLKDEIINFKPNLKLLYLAVFIFSLISVFINPRIGLNMRIYNNPFFSIIGSFTGIYIVICVSLFICRTKYLAFIFLKCGEASLFILIFHMFIQTKVLNFLSNLSDKTTSEVTFSFYAMISVIAGILISILIRKIVIRNSLLSLVFLPFKSNKLLQRTLFAYHRAKQR